ncbi:MAG: HU family DNA-binding protein [Deltaproteobacteria bacterium]|nr:HU family DNA-binding protein [Deltaproteobacteria bacterium]
MTRTKSDHILSVAGSCALSRSRSAQVVNTLIELIKRALERGEEVSIRRFGKFRVCDRNGLKPRTNGQEYFMPAGARRIVIFRSSPALDERINVEDLP